MYLCDQIKFIKKQVEAGAVFRKCYQINTWIWYMQKSLKIIRSCNWCLQKELLIMTVIIIIIACVRMVYE